MPGPRLRARRLLNADLDDQSDERLRNARIRFAGTDDAQIVYRIVGTEDFDMPIEPIRTGRFVRLRNELLQRITEHYVPAGEHVPA